MVFFISVSLRVECRANYVADGECVRLWVGNEDVEIVRTVERAGDVGFFGWGVFLFRSLHEDRGREREEGCCRVSGSGFVRFSIHF